MFPHDIPTLNNVHFLWCAMKKWMIWLGLVVIIIIGACLGVAKLFDPHDACINSGGHWTQKHCEY